MVGVAGLDILLPTVEDGLAGQQLREDAPDRPYVNGLSNENVRSSFLFHNRIMITYIVNIRRGRGRGCIMTKILR